MSSHSIYARPETRGANVVGPSRADEDKGISSTRVAVRGLGWRNPDPTRGRPKPMAKSSALPGHWPSQWLTRPLGNSLGHWPSESYSHQGSSLGHWPSEPSSSSLGQWPSEPQPAQDLHSANGRVNLTTMFTRPLADPTSSNADPSILTRPRGLQTTPWLPINTKAPPLVQVIHF